MNFKMDMKIRTKENTTITVETDIHLINLCAFVLKIKSYET